MKTPTLARLEPPNGYPETEPDEQRMPNTAWHGFVLGLVLQALRWFFRDAERVCVESDMFVCFDRADRDKTVGPDVFIVCGAERRWRRNWLTWEEGTPHLVIELTSESTRARDTGAKFRLYRDVLKVPEYFLFDPEGHLLRPRLQGFRLVGEEYVGIEPVDGRLPSAVLGLHLEQDEDELRFWDPAAEAWVPTADERAADAAARAEDEAARADDEATRAADALRRAADEARRADDEARRADAAETRIRELEAELARRGGVPPAEEGGTP